MRIPTASKWMTIVDRVTWRHLLASVAGLTLLFAFSYWLLSKLNPNNGLKPPEWEHSVSFPSAIYFSIVTETTLGYGDFLPMGFSRLLVVLQVMSGLVLAGIVVARVTSAQGRAARILAYKISGDWLEYWEEENKEIMITHAVMFTDGEVLRYNGENFDSSGTYKGFFHGQLIDGEGQCYRFSYCNRDSVTDYFVEGIASVMFQPSEASNRWHRHTATSRDFGTKREVTYHGRRATEEEAEILRGPDLATQIEIVKSYAKSIPKST